MNFVEAKFTRTVVLCLGNDLLADDGIGVRAAERLRHELDGAADVVISSMSGLALIDCLIGYDRAVIVDAIHSGSRPIGSIHRLSPKDLRIVHSPSPHFTGIPEMLGIASSLSLKFPSQISIVAVEVDDVQTIGGDISREVLASLDLLVAEVLSAVTESERGRD